MFTQMSPVERITNSYKSLYLGNENSDTVADEALRQGLMASFQKHDTLISEIGTEKGHRDVFGHGIELGAESLLNDKLSDTLRDDMYERLDKFVKDVDIFTGSDTAFYKEIYNNYEAKYKGETVDYGTDYARYERSISNELPFESPEPVSESHIPKEMTQEEIEQVVSESTDEMFTNYMENNSLKEERANVLEVTEKEPVGSFSGSGLAYNKPSPDVDRAKGKQAVRQFETKDERMSRIQHERTYEGMRQESGLVDKQTKQHHEHARKHNPNQHFSHADSYGIEEKEVYVKSKAKDDNDLEL